MGATIEEFAGRMRSLLIEIRALETKSARQPCVAFGSPRMREAYLEPKSPQGRRCAAIVLGLWR